jgi:predicted kinase
MSDEQLDALTQQGMEALRTGDRATADAAFGQRDNLARDIYREDGEPAPSPSPSNGERVSSETLDQISEILCSTGHSDMADATLSSTVEHALAYAEQFDRQHPVLAQEIADLASTDARVYSLVLKYAAAQGRQTPRQAAVPAPSRTNPDRSYQPVEPILTRQEAIQTDIDQMIAQHPPGSMG